MSKTLHFRLLRLPPRTSSLEVANHVSKSKVGSIESIDLGGNGEATIKFKTDLSFAQVKKKLENERIKGRRIAMRGVPRDGASTTSSTTNGATSKNGRRGRGNAPSNSTPTTNGTITRNGRRKLKLITDDHDDDDELRNGHYKKKEPASPAKPPPTPEEIEELATCFHLHVNIDSDLLEKVSDRDEMGRIFQQFLCDMSPEERTPKECKSLETKVMSSLRQQRLLRSKRLGSRVVMTLARMGGPGDFPTAQEMESVRDKVAVHMATEQENKEGVNVSDAKFTADQQAVRPRQSLSFSLTLTATDGSIVLEGLKVGGPKRNAYSIVEPTVFPMTLPAGSETTCHFVFSPTRFGQYRNELRFSFLKGDGTKFQIARNVKLRCGEKKPEPAATTSNVPRPVEVFHPPTQLLSTGGESTNFFRNFPSYKIPPTVRPLIVDQNLSLIKPRTMEAYVDYWQKVLWTSEYQSHNDITLFDMKQVALQRMGKYFLFSWAGLIEGRPSIFQADILHLYWKDKLFRARVHEVLNGCEIVLELHEVFLQTFKPESDTVDVRFTFIRTTARTCHDGVAKSPQTMGNAMLLPTVETVKECLAASASRTVNGDLTFANRSLDAEQQSAVMNIVKGASRPMPYILWGPPGTGKTVTLVEAVYQLVTLGSKVLVVAPSNVACDLLVEKLASHLTAMELCRLLGPGRTVPEDSGDVVRRYARAGLADSALARVAQSAKVVVCTTALAARLESFGLPRGFFDVLCVDEANQATEPEVLGVASRLMDFTTASKGQLVMVGDPQQLSPLISSVLCREHGMGVSYLERLAKTEVYAANSQLCTKLQHNYRSHAAILKLPSELYYAHAVVASKTSTTNGKSSEWQQILPNKDFPVLFHSVTEGENVQEGSSPAWYNPSEATEVVNYVHKLITAHVPQADIGVIAAFNRQAQEIRSSFLSLGLTDVKVGTVDSFQGQERQFIIVSTVRTSESHIVSDLKYNLGLIGDAKRFNVMMNRAGSMLVVVGNPNALATDHSNWVPFLRYCKDSWVGDPSWDDAVPKTSVEELLEQAKQRLPKTTDPGELAAQVGIAFVNREE